MRFKAIGNKADNVIGVVRNNDTVSIPRGTPLVLQIDQTNDGLDVLLPSTAGNPLSAALRYGVALSTMAVGDYGETFLFGVCPYVLISRMTRAASTDSWTSSASQASGIGLGLDTLNNVFLLGASAAGSVLSAPNAVLIDSLASAAASASATSDSRTAVTSGVRAFVRML